jgi:hypothetical protein
MILHCKGRLLALSVSVRLGWKRQTVTNILYGINSVRKKSFIVQALVGKLTAVSLEFLNCETLISSTKLDCLLLASFYGLV